MGSVEKNISICFCFFENFNFFKMAAIFSSIFGKKMGKMIKNQYMAAILIFC